jgi:hypothetical protein
VPGYVEAVYTSPPTPADIQHDLPAIGADEYDYFPKKVGTVIMDIGSYTAGEKLDTRTLSMVKRNSKSKWRWRSLTKGKDRKPETVSDVSNKLSKLLKKLHLGSKASHYLNRW